MNAVNSTRSERSRMAAGSLLGGMFLAFGLSCSSTTSLDSWLEEQLESLRDKNESGLADASSNRRSSHDARGTQSFVVALERDPSDDPGLRFDADDYRKRWVDDLTSMGLSQVANQEQAEEILDELSRQSSRLYDETARDRIGRITGADLLIRIRCESNYTRNIPVPEGVERGVFRYRSTKCAAESLDLESGVVVHEELIDLLTIAGPAH